MEKADEVRTERFKMRFDSSKGIYQGKENGVPVKEFEVHYCSNEDLEGAA